MALSSQSLTSSCAASSFPLPSPSCASKCISSLSFPAPKPRNPNFPNPLSEKWRTSTTRTRVSFFPGFLSKPKDAGPIKEDLLQAVQPLDRGADASPDDQQRIDQITRKLEAVNPTKEPLKSDLLSGKWELIYTTSTSILKKERPKFLRSRVNYQAINTDTLRAQNMESAPFFNQVTADLTPLSPRKVAVKFDYFKILGLIPVKAPETALGELEITYLDEDLRVSRGDKGNLFILKMIDPSYRIPSK